jgi:hypothetical protein
MGGGGVVPLVLHVGIRWRWVVSFPPWPLYRQEGAQYPLNRRVGSRRSGCFREEERLVPMLEFWIPGHPACSLVTVPTELSQIHPSYRNQKVWRWGNIQWYKMPTKSLENLSVGSEVGVLIHGYISIEPCLRFSPSRGSTQFYIENSFCISQPRGSVTSTRGLGPTMTTRGQSIGISIGMLPQTLIMSRLDQLSRRGARS